MSTPQPPGNPEPRPLRPTRSGAIVDPSAARPRMPAEGGPPVDLAAVPLREDRVLVFVVVYAVAFVVENSEQINGHFVFATANVRLIWTMLLLPR